MTTVFELWHTDEEADNEGTLIGIYSSEEKALAIIPAVSEHPDFKGQPGELRVYHSTIDETGWEEGFITWAEALLPKE
jgi:hypothetical protein